MRITTRYPRHGKGVEVGFISWNEITQQYSVGGELEAFIAELELLTAELKAFNEKAKETK